MSLLQKRQSVALKMGFFPLGENENIHIMEFIYGNMNSINMKIHISINMNILFSYLKGKGI